jgi:stage II sporulation protein R
MKKKYLAIIYLLFLSFGTIFSLSIPKNEVTANDALIIPNDAIRLRILANSDSSHDQEIKRLVRDEVNKEITKWVSDIASKEEAKKVMQSGLPELQQIAEQVLEEENANQTVKVEFGKVEFPTKLYGQFLYPAGEYEAILITLGEGTGANWWCVLFPPLCFLDFSNGVAVSEGFDEKEEIEVEEEKESVETAKKAIEKVAVDQKAEQTPVYTNEEEESTEEVPAYTSEEEESTEEVPVYTNEKEESTEEAPVYTNEDEQPVEVKFFLKEVWDHIFS